MKAEDLRLEELVDFSEGLVSLHGRRLLLHDVHAFVQFRRDLMEMMGPEQARRILTRFGYFSGQADAAAMKRIFQWDNLQEWVKAGPHLHSMQGAARDVINRLDIDEATGAFHMEITWHDSAEAHENKAAPAHSSECACWMLSGYASGYASFCMGANIYFVEEKCIAKGDLVCSAIGKDEASWGQEVAGHLGFFRANDIKGKIRDLTHALKQKDRELQSHIRRVRFLQGLARPFYVEVRSEKFSRVLDLATRAARFDSSVLITGETGTGKEVLARYIHRSSSRVNAPFVGVNCGALPETLLESELFGHKKGSFTGAVQDRIGLFEQAEGGTIFLDEIGDITPSMQLKILRVLQEREIMRVGESKTRKIDVRVIAATNRDLKQGIHEGRFREDLFYRLKVIEIELPPLRERKEDILPLARYLFVRLAKRLKIPNLHMDATCMAYLEAYPWPGNVRELENSLERAAVLCKDGHVMPEDFAPHILSANGVSRHSSVGSIMRSLADVEKEHILAVLEEVGGNKARAAKVLGISSTTLWRKMREQGMDNPLA